MDWIKLVKGDEKNLEGRVIVYSKLQCEKEDFTKCESCTNEEYCSGNKEGEHIFALYGTTDVNDFIERTGAPEELRKFNELEDKINSEIYKIFGVKIKTKNFMASPIEIDSEEELLADSADIVFTGNYSSPIGCQKSVESGIDIYAIKLVEQLSRRYGQEEFSKKQSQPKIKTYKDINTNDIKNYIQNNFISPIFYAKSYREEEKIKDLKKSFMKFSVGSTFFDEVSKLCKYIEEDEITSRLNKKCEILLQIITAKHRLREALDNENYEFAAKIRDDIKRLNSEK